MNDGRHPTQGYVFDWSTGNVEIWHSPSTPEIDTTQFARAQLDSYPARDRTKIPVLVRRPQKCAATPCPVVVAFHGGPEAQARPGFSVVAEMFVNAGFVFVEPNVRGSDGFGKTWLHADDGRKRLDVITDIEDAAKWARLKFAAGGKEPKVGIYGGYSVLMEMTMFGGAYNAGVDVVGISHLRTFFAQHSTLQAHSAHQRIRRPGQRRRGARQALADDLRRSRQSAAPHPAGRQRSARSRR